MRGCSWNFKEEGVPGPDVCHSTRGREGRTVAVDDLHRRVQGEIGPMNDEPGLYPREILPFAPRNRRVGAVTQVVVGGGARFGEDRELVVAREYRERFVDDRV